MFGEGLRGRVVLAVMSDEIPVGIEAEDMGVMRGKTGGEVLLGEQDLDLGIVEHEGEPVFGIGQIKGNIGGAGFENAEQPDDEVEGAIGADTDPVVGPDAESDQVMGELIGPGIEFAVAEAAIFKDEGDGLRGFLDLVLEQFDDGLGTGEVGGLVELMEDLLTFGIRKNIEAAERLRDIVENGGDQLLEMMAEPGDPIGEEEVGVVPEGGVKRVIAFFEAEGEIELAGGVLIEEGSDAQVIEREIGTFDVLKSEHDIEEG